MTTTYSPHSVGYGLVDKDKVNASLVSATDGLVANAGGGQANATMIPSAINRFTVVATIGDSAQLPVAMPGMEVTVVNGGAASLSVYSNVKSATDQINNAVGTTAYVIAANHSAFFVCPSQGFWHAISGN